MEKALGRRTNVGRKAEATDQFRPPRCGLCVMKLCAPGPSSAVTEDRSLGRRGSHPGLRRAPADRLRTTQPVNNALVNGKRETGVEPATSRNLDGSLFWRPGAPTAIAWRLVRGEHLNSADYPLRVLGHSVSPGV